jgi:hypothetical protein
MGRNKTADGRATPRSRGSIEQDASDVDVTNGTLVDLLPGEIVVRCRHCQFEHRLTLGSTDIEVLSAGHYALGCRAMPEGSVFVKIDRSEDN